MTRQESIRKQYEAASQTSNPRLPPRTAGVVRPRNRFWLWFWILLILALLGGFFCLKDARESVCALANRLLGHGGGETAPSAEVVNE